MFDGALLVALREGVEISLMIGIILSYLKKLGRQDGAKYVWLGTFLAALVTAAVGFVLYKVTGSGQEWAYQTYLEAGVMLIAVVMLSYMTIWMKRNSSQLGKNMQAKIESVLADKGVAWLTLLAFLTVIREGIETAMFLLGLSYQGANNTGAVVKGAVVGFAVSAVIGLVIYRGTHRIRLKAFFQVMGTLLIVVAAGLLASATGSLIQAHLLHPVFYLFSINGFLSEGRPLGAVLHALIGYSDHPSILQVGAWVIYLVVALVLYNRKGVLHRPSSVDSAQSVPIQ